MTRVRTGPTPDRLALAREVAALRSQGLIYAEIAERLGISPSYANALALDPDGSGDRARKDGYGGTCEDCGGPTSGSNGREEAPTVCASCSWGRQRQEKHWTREAVIDAIQRFAAVHGRPPVADEWIRSDPDRGYPPRTSVYRSSTKHRSSPFARWADAIEAAGFPRPTTGRRTAKMPTPRNAYIVLREKEDGTWEEMGTHETHSAILALNAALNGNEPTGRWVAVPGRYWQPRGLQTKTIYEFVSE